jgi:superfamily II DNA or RNA helicase
MPDLFTDSLATLPGADIETSIIDNAGENTLRNRLRVIGDESKDVSIASAFFSLDALYMLADLFAPMDKIRLLFGDDADGTQRKQLLNMLRTRSDEDLRTARDDSPTLQPLQRIARLFAEGKIEARCYVQKKFHAKAYLFRYSGVRKPEGVIGSGNFTRAGLTRNVELNVQLTSEQRTQLAAWFEERWNEAQADVVTEDLLAEVRRQIELYSPYILYLKALTAWGNGIQDTGAAVGPGLENVLDPHQEIAFKQSLKILERHNGVMICDGVGLGKSFTALAIMQWYLRRGKKVLLVAPKSIITASWEGYIQAYLKQYTRRCPAMYTEAMTAFGFDPTKPLSARKLEDLQDLSEQMDVVVIDESHNFRTPSSSRYKNMYALVAPQLAGRKKIVLMTATPINTEYADLAAQVALTTHDEGDIDGRGIAPIRRAAANLDKAARQARNGGSLVVQTSLDFLRGVSGGTDDQGVLREVLESLVIQRSRKTCKELAASAGKELRFPVRRDPVCLEYGFDNGSESYRELIQLSDRLFRPGIDLLEKLRKAEQEAKAKGKKYDPLKILQRAKGGIKLAAFSLSQYQLETESRSDKRDKDEIHLARLVFTNALKQLESSPVAYQGIVQSLAVGLLARLQYVCGDEAAGVIAKHGAWVNTSLFVKEETAEYETEAETPDDSDELLKAGDETETSGDETDAWLEYAIQSRKLDRTLKEFSAKTHEVDRWMADIVSDLGYLKEIHDATLAARRQADPKLAEVERVLREAVSEGKRVLVFSQSQRTAEYLERELKNRLGKAFGVARVDSHITDQRPTILHAFCPGYNPAPEHPSPSVPRRVDVLISTDVLAEGVNLQEAGMILNYDIHWNPVRLIQRIGRVDRRLNPKVTPDAHEFGIVNVVPPDEIDAIIELVGRIEERTIKISKTLGLETSFLRAGDGVEALKEFNAKYDGELSDADEALTRYVNLTTIAPPDARTLALMEQIPPGAFGVWNGADRNGIFAYFSVVPKKTATEEDKKRFASVLTRPYLALLYDGETKPVLDAPRVLAALQAIAPGTPSANPSDDELLKTRLKQVTNAVRNSFRSIGLPNTLVPSLVCWMELRHDS